MRQLVNENLPGGPHRALEMIRPRSSSPLEEAASVIERREGQPPQATNWSSRPAILSSWSPG